ncbi:hypothetical protein AB0L13_03825 [Saccharopolyspora shandongensis]
MAVPGDQDRRRPQLFQRWDRELGTQFLRPGADPGNHRGESAVYAM